MWESRPEMDPVPRTTLNMAFEALLNRVLALDPISQTRLAPWHDHYLTLSLQPPGAWQLPEVELHLYITDEGIRVLSDPGSAADARVSAPPLAMLRFLAPSPLPASGSQPGPAADVRIAGNEALVDAFRDLLRELEPDWEGELARHFGDIIAHEAGRRVRRGLNWGRRASDSLLRNVEEYLEEEARLVPSRHELSACRENAAPLEQQLDDLAERIARLEQRLRDTQNRP